MCVFVLFCFFFAFNFWKLLKHFWVYQKGNFQPEKAKITPGKNRENVFAPPPTLKKLFCYAPGADCMNKNFIMHVFSTGFLVQVKGYTCEVGNERNLDNEWKWVLPYPDPCECTSVIMGGMNTWTPTRPFVPTYADTPLLSEDVKTIRKHYKLNCNEGKLTAHNSQK